MSSNLKGLAKWLAGCLVSEYRINWIYAADTLPSPDDNEYVVETERAAYRRVLRTSAASKMRKSQKYADAGLAGLVLVEDGRPLSVAHFADTSQYDRPHTWRLRGGEVALMDIATEEDVRGRGLAPCLIRAATRHYLAHGCKRLIAFVWWTNNPSLRAFKKAEWKRIGLSVELRFGKRWLRIRIPLVG